MIQLQNRIDYGLSQELIEEDEYPMIWTESIGKRRLSGGRNQRYPVA
jgi:hypothetical protein